MKVCMIGYTGHNNYVLEGLRRDERATVVGIAPGPDEENQSELIEKLESLGEKPKNFHNYKKMLESQTPDVVTVACHFNNHSRVSQQALAGGYNVFVEKPVATTLDELTRLRNSFESSEGSLVTMFGSRYQPWFETARNIIEEGAIGSIRLMNAQKSYVLGDRSSLYRNRNSYGGTIPWVGSHAIDWLYWFSEKEFESVFATHSTLSNKNHGELESTALCLFELEDEIMGSVSLDYLRPRGATSHGDDRLRLAGKKGILEIIDDEVYLINQEVEGIRKVPLKSKKESIFKDFLDYLRGSGKCKISAKTSFYVTEVALKARSSADQGKLIKI